MTTAPAAPAALEGSRCTVCGNVAFPVATGCQRCGSDDTAVLPLSSRGTVWGWTVQRFAPKSPPYVPPAEGFRPFAVGYVELPEGVKVEAVLDPRGADFATLSGAQVALVATEPVPCFAVVDGGAR
ncbi:MAG: OB-fold domain-containing protein [Nocardioides alkalitolerans]